QGRKINLFAPREIYNKKKDKEGSLDWFIKKWKDLGLDVTIRLPYKAKEGLMGLKGSSVDKGAIGILIAEQSVLEKAGEESDEGVKDFLLGKRGPVRVIGIPDIYDRDKQKDIFDGKGWEFANEVQEMAFLLAAVTPGDIAEKEYTGTPADDFMKAMNELRKEDLDKSYLYSMLSHDELTAINKEDLPEDLAASLESKNPFEWLVFIVKNLLIQMPIKPFDPASEMHNRRKVLMAA
ncbi:MAG: hypothetical protein ABH883_06325, partial [Candidatus Omnitrophota bacterium]